MRNLLASNIIVRKAVAYLQVQYIQYLILTVNVGCDFCSKERKGFGFVYFL